MQHLLYKQLTKIIQFGIVTAIYHSHNSSMSYETKKRNYNDKKTKS
jgi:hypothetical protein